MTTFEAGEFTLREVRDYVWEMEAEDGMNVPARVLASEALLEEIQDDKTLQQIRNVAHLPGIQEAAICMPDGHQGYGFPVGGVAAIDAEDGCISPGGVGYDINCLAGDSDVLLEFGRRAEIRSLDHRFEDERTVVAGDVETASDIQLFTETSKKTVYQVETEAGDVVEASADHPFLTPEGMVELGNLAAGDTVFVHPFEGLPDEEPPEFVVLDEDDFAEEDPQLLGVLRERDLLPLRSTDDAFNRLLKLVGYHTGDGSFGSGSQTWFYGESEDLGAIQRDIEAVGFTPSRIYERDRRHEIDGQEFQTTEYSVRSTSNALKQLLVRLGAPEGKKVESGFSVPAYLDRLADWQTALYLSAFFGAEMSAPSAVAAKNFYSPEVTNTRIASRRDEAEQFVASIAGHLNDLGVRTNEVGVTETDSNASHPTVRARLGISSEPRNLIRFFTTVGYRYSESKQRRAVKAAQYLKQKERVIQRRARMAERARTLADGGLTPRDVKNRLDVNDRLVERSLWSGRTDRPRPPADFPDIEEFFAETTVRENNTVEATVAAITELGEKSVYDIGVEHDAHNFVANGFVVSNCGVRMVKTNLTYDDLQGKEEELVTALFDAVPSGLGKGGVVETTADVVEEVLDRGMDWALEEGYAVEDDLEHCEDGGYRPDADPDAVSQDAKNRGKNQLGSLGSGNHFLEVQRVTDVYREDVADAYGLEENQVVVLIHSGSRGFGHQVCTDYLRKIERRHADLLSELPDRELAAAPAGSDLAEEYYGAMCAAINFAWTNRQLIMHATRQVFEDVFDTPWQDLGMDLLYDVAHNIAKKEVHEVDGEEKELYVHRKGATRAFPAGHPEVPEAYRDVGQPVIIPGSMGSGSYVLRGGEESMGLTFGSTAHGAGRVMSRTQAKKEFWGGDVQDELREQQHIYVKAQSGATVAEEAPGVYKDVDEVVRVSDELGIGDRVARTYPVVNIKG